MCPQVVLTHRLLHGLDAIKLALWSNHGPFNEHVANAPLTQGAQMFHVDVGHLVLLDHCHFHKGTCGGSGIGVCGSQAGNTGAQEAVKKPQSQFYTNSVPKTRVHMSSGPVQTAGPTLQPLDS